MSHLVDEHRQYLADRPRISAFDRAIQRVVKRGDVVLDLGSGSGILGLLACRAGASRVYSVEEGGMIEFAQKVCAANGFQERVRFIKGLSTRVELPEKVHVVVADQIGRFGFEAGLLEYYADARTRFLAPGGVMIPARLDLCVAPVECAEVFERIEFWNDSPLDFDFRPARTWAVNTAYPTKLRPEHLLGGPATIASLDMSTAEPEALSLEAAVTADKDGTLHGIGGWFTAQLSEGIEMSNSPLSAEPINRMNVVFPIDRPTPLRRGDCVRVTMRILPSELLVTWTVEVEFAANEDQERRPRPTSFTHSTFKGMLVSKEDILRTRPDFVPKLSPWGEARHTILNLCDGRRSLAEIEREVYGNHAKLFSSAGQAAAFVAEVVTRYSQ